MNNPFDGSHGMPGTRVFDGMNAAFQSNRNYQAMMQDYMARKEAEKNLPLLDLERQIAQSNLSTQLPLTQSRNKALGVINEFGHIDDQAEYAAMYSKLTGSNYTPGTDDKGNAVLYKVGKDGSLGSPVPSHTGISARNNAVMTFARDLNSLEGKIPQERQAEANVALQLAMQENAMQSRQMENLLKMQGQMLAGFGGGSGGGGGRGGKKGSGSGTDMEIPKAYSPDKNEADFLLKQAKYMASNLLGAKDVDGVLHKVVVDESGMSTEVPMTTAEVAEYDAEMMAAYQNLLAQFAVYGDVGNSLTKGYNTRVDAQNKAMRAAQSMGLYIPQNYDPNRMVQGTPGSVYTPGMEFVPQGISVLGTQQPVYMPGVRTNRPGYMNMWGPR